MTVVVKNIIKLMEQRGLTDALLCKECNFNHNALYNWKNGHSSPNRKTLEKLCAFFDVPLNYFYQEVDNDMLCELQTIFAQLSPDEQRVVLQNLYSQFPRLNKH